MVSVMASKKKDFFFFEKHENKFVRKFSDIGPT